MARAAKSAKMQGFMRKREECERALEVAERVARDAGSMVLRGWRGGGDISHKGRFDLLTEHDLRSEELIRAELEHAFPGHRIVGEETAETGDGELVWYGSSAYRSPSTMAPRGWSESSTRRHSERLGRPQSTRARFETASAAKYRRVPRSKKPCVQPDSRTIAGRRQTTIAKSYLCFYGEHVAFGAVAQLRSIFVSSPTERTTSTGSKASMRGTCALVL